VPPGTPRPSEVTFDTASVWVHSDTDSTALLVEVAATFAQQSVGLSGRSRLDRDSGMLFVFDSIRPDTTGFWMWQTAVPLDVAYLDQEGVILRIVGMEPCDGWNEDDCTLYFAEVEYARALEVNRGWFARNGIGVGDRVRVVGEP